VSGKFAHGHLVGRFLKFENLLVNKLAFLMGDHIRIEGALLAGLFTRKLFTAAPSGKR
jgi:hypothetical protein